MAKEIEPKLKLIGNYLKLEQKEVFVIPEYQRAYEWSQEQCDKLFCDIEDFVSGGEQEAEESQYFFGNIIVDCSKQGELQLIDGQQRTTTFFLLLKALLIRLQEVLKTFVEYGASEPLGEGLREKRNQIIYILYKADTTKRCDIERDWNKAKGVKLIVNNSINEQYKDELQLILEAKDFQEVQNVVSKKGNRYTNFFKNFKNFYEKLCQYQESVLNDFANKVLCKCQLIEIRSWQFEQAISMFHSLNSTGLPLNDCDIISASLYSNAGANKEEFNRTWQDLCATTEYLEKQKVSSMDGIMQQYMYIYRAQNKITDTTVQGLRSFFTRGKGNLLKDPLKLTGDLQKIANIWDDIKDYATTKLLLKFNENCKMFFISFLYRYKDLECVLEDKVKDIVECFLRLFCLLELVEAGYSSKNFKAWLFKENIRLVDLNVSIQEIRKDFDFHITQNYKQREQEIRLLIENYEKNALVFLNEYLYTKENNLDFVIPDSVNIEHIIPKSGSRSEDIRKEAGMTTKDFKKLVNRLGNKILLDEKINKRLGNTWFKAKQKGYKKSQYCQIARALAQSRKPTWKKSDIEAATQKASDRIARFLFG